LKGQHNHRMQIGIFAKTFQRPTLGEVFEAVVRHGLRTIQFNFACLGLPTLPERIAPEVIAEVQREMRARRIRMAAISGTFNLIHPRMEERRAGLRRLRILAQGCHDLGTSIITLCTGTRDPFDMWRRHVDNDSPEAWQEMVAAMQEAAAIAEENQVTLGVEPETGNIVSSARKARQLLRELQSPHIKIVMDPANLFRAGELRHMRRIMDEAFELLGQDIAIAHAKDLDHNGEAGHLAAGTGVLDYDHYFRLLKTAGWEGPLILHALREDQVPRAVAFLEGKLAQRELGPAS